MMSFITIPQSLLRRWKAHHVLRRIVFFGYIIKYCYVVSMAEASLLYDGESQEGSKDERSVWISEFPSTITSVENEAVNAAPTKKPERRSRSSKDSKIAS